jgi:hypothetical protein
MSKIAEEKHIGIMRLHDRILRDILNVEATTTQGELRDNGVFIQVHKRLLLPESYTIVGAYYRVDQRSWLIVVESDDIPLAAEGEYYPDVSPTYVLENGEPKLLTIDVATNKMIGISNDELMKRL